MVCLAQTRGNEILEQVRQWPGRDDCSGARNRAGRLEPDEFCDYD
jgi:hypothetical protein